ncbi:hypothetical protein MHL31_00235 [Lutibacter sp. A80]|uniref:hypothetical protein n=1 Tax=Lutibacter sp. A80 TaxID=2918453 RepID=UPI001F066E1D|nr:hypothetical protein [Lutibacter sp. A80]UMB60655.1 hypothetical protein MHL31_00235 [Lutibacter sp. A80]
MKEQRLHQMLKILLLISIYCFGIFVPVNIVPLSKEQGIEKSNEQQGYFSNISKVPYVHTQESERLLSESTDYISLNFNLLYKGVCITLFSSELLLKNKYKQYRAYFRNLLIRNRKSDLIFPFHNFW